MPRSRSSSRSSSPTRTSSPTRISSPKHAMPAASFTNHVTHEQPSFLSNVISGFAWGAGSSIARNIFSSSPTTTHVPVESQKISEEYEKCLIDTHGDSAACKHLKK